MSHSFRDAIGDRLNHPENVPEELKHLIADDVARVEKILSIPVSGRVLDVGCSDGAITKRIAAKWGTDTVGVDVRPTDCFQGGFNGYIQHDVRRPFNRLAVPYDAIYACEVFEHLTDDDADLALATLLGVLNEGGTLIVSVPNRECADEYVAGCRDRWKWPDHRSVWTHRRLVEFLGPHFSDLKHLPLDARDYWLDTTFGCSRWIDRSIWLIVHASGKK